MEHSVFNANTYGLGQLISQKKRLAVPLHQRSFSWGSAEVEQFLEDIFYALEQDYPNYFLGSLVLTQPLEGSWGILDGQQRLTTASIVYSSIRWLLYENMKAEDADQIVSEYLGVRRLGGESSSRLLLNAENKEVYTKAVVDLCSDSDIDSLKVEFKGSRSNQLLLKAITTSRKIIKEWSSPEDNQEERISRLYKLSSYMEKKALVVAIEVADETDAYVVFETLNTRGQDLSALDLVKNFVFGNSKVEMHGQIVPYWTEMKSNIGERQADDFLRIFWMGNYGLIQKSRLYPNLKIKFNTPELSFELARLLSEGSDIYAALEEPKHHLWHPYSALCLHLLEILHLLKSKQTRPIVYACLNIGNTSNEIMEHILWDLVVLTIRFQTIGKRRQGILEKTCAKIAQNISASARAEHSYIQSEIEKILPGDLEFEHDFRKHIEPKLNRALYFLLSIEFHTRDENKNYEQNWESINELLESQSTSLTHVFSSHSTESEITDEDEFIDETIDLVDKLGNWIIVDASLRPSKDENRFEELKELVKDAEFQTTVSILEFDSWGVAEITSRQSGFSKNAALIWTLSQEV